MAFGHTYVYSSRSKCSCSFYLGSTTSYYFRTRFPWTWRFRNVLFIYHPRKPKFTFHTTNKHSIHLARWPAFEAQDNTAGVLWSDEDCPHNVSLQCGLPKSSWKWLLATINPRTLQPRTPSKGPAIYSKWQLFKNNFFSWKNILAIIWMHYSYRK